MTNLRVSRSRLRSRLHVFEGGGRRLSYWEAQSNESEGESK